MNEETVTRQYKRLPRAVRILLYPILVIAVLAICIPIIVYGSVSRWLVHTYKTWDDWS